jgi:drug/metabolite transporter (DMT)-like permease
MLVPFMIWEYSTGATLKFDFISMATLGYAVIFPSTLAYLFFNRGLALIEPNRAAPFFHLVPCSARRWRSCCSANNCGYSSWAP